MGSKSHLLTFIENTITKYCGKNNSKIIGDLFCGTSAVSVLFKKLGYAVIANDNLAFCATMAKSYLLNNKEPQFSSLMKSKEIKNQSIHKLFPTAYEKILNYLNQLPGEEDFIYREYSPGGTAGKEHERKYFADKNAKKIDAIRNKIKNWRNLKLINESEEALLLASLLKSANKVANIAGTYGYFMKDWIDSRVWKPLTLECSKIIESKKKHRVFQEDANELVKRINCDILYLDPPYNWRHYGAYYHILETIVKWDNPLVEGRSGLRPWQESKSRYSYRNEALNALTELIENANAERIFLSYNNEGLISREEICSMLTRFGELHIEEVPYRRYKSNNSTTQKRKVKERLYYVKKGKK